MPSQLVDLTVKEVSGVGAAANMRKFIIVKSATPGNTLKDKLNNIIKRYLPSKPETALTFTQALAYETLDSQLEDMMYDASYALRESIKSIMGDNTVTDKVAAVNQSLSEFSQVISQAMQNALGMIGATPAQAGTISKSEEGNHMPFEFTEEVLKQLPEDVRKGVLELQEKVKQVDELQKKVAELEKSKQPEKNEEDILKGVPEAVRKMVEEANERARQAEEVAKAERETRLKKEYIAKASEFKALSVNPEEFGPVLKSIAESCPEAYTKVEAVLKAANNAIATGEILKTYGADGEGSGSAWDEIVRKAVELRKGDPSLSVEAAQAKVMKENPELYNRYREELKSV